MSNLLIFLGTLLLIGSALGRCPDGWVRHGRSCYFFSQDRETMADASYICRSMRGELAIVGSYSEHNYLYWKIRSLRLGLYWIGLNDIQQEGVWRWFGKYNYKAGYKNWAPGQPQNSGRDENCVVITNGGGGKWHDYPCRSTMRFVCERRTCTDC